MNSGDCVWCDCICMPSVIEYDRISLQQTYRLYASRTPFQFCLLGIIFFTPKHPLQYHPGGLFTCFWMLGRYCFLMMDRQSDRSWALVSVRIRRSRFIDPVFITPPRRSEWQPILLHVGCRQSPRAASLGVVLRFTVCLVAPIPSLSDYGVDVTYFAIESSLILTTPRMSKIDRLEI